MRRTTSSLLVLSLVFLGGSSCLLDPVEAPPTTSTTAAPTTAASPTTTAPPVTTSTTAAPTTTTTAAPTTTTTVAPSPTAFPIEVVQNYVKQVLTAEVDIGQLVQEIVGISDDWDNRSDTGVSFPDTEEAMVDVVERVEAAGSDFNGIQAPPSGGFPQKHLTVSSAVRQITEAAAEMLAGLQSTDTGEQRQAAQVSLNAAYGVFVGSIDEIIAEYIGDDEVTALIVSRGVPAPAPAPEEPEPTTTTTSAEESG